jgi:uncharacterized alkaline shock family protein YloU
LIKREEGKVMADELITDALQAAASDLEGINTLHVEVAKKLMKMLESRTSIEVQTGNTRAIENDLETLVIEFLKEKHGANH